MKQSLLLSYRCLTVFAAHYRQAPIQASAILVGIILAVTLLIGIKATNENAINSYSQATELLSHRASVYINPAIDADIDEQVYFALSQAGINSLPVLEGVATGPNGQGWQVTGNDIVAALSVETAPKQTIQTSQHNTVLFQHDIPLSQLLAGYPAIIMSQSLADRVSPSRIASLNQTDLNVIAISDDAGLGNAILGDLSLVQTLLNKPSRLSYIAVYPTFDTQSKTSLIKQVNQALVNANIDISQLSIQADDDGASLSALTDSFHLNLKAMGMLSFLVGLFIAYNGVRYSLMKRQSLCVQLMQQGVTRNSLIISLAVELVVLVMIGTALGFIVGLQLSQWLQPMVALTLEQLYGARLAPGIWHWQWLFEALSLTLSAAFFACIPMIHSLTRTPLAQASYKQPQGQRYRALHKKQFNIGLILLITSCTLFAFTTQYQYSLMLLGGVTVAIPLMLPRLLSFLMTAIEQINLTGLAQYAIAEARQIIAPLSLAMMAMLLAICANISMNTLVGSFEVTLKNWLESRLHADLYIRPGSEKMTDLSVFLKQHDNISGVYSQWTADAHIRQADQTQPIAISLVSRDLESLKTTTALKDKTANFWPEFTRGKQVMISEPLAIKNGFKLGDNINIDKIASTLTVGAIYFDYGNPMGEAIISDTLWLQSSLPPTPISLAVDYNGELTDLENQLSQSFGLSSSAMYSQQKIKAEAITIFKRTFSITLVLNSLTLIVAAIGLFSAATMLTQSRLAPLARLYSLGVSRKQLQLMALAQMLIMVLLTCVIAMPMGALLGYLVINKVTLQAFGWSIAMVWDWASYLQVVFISVISCMLAVALPLYWQTRKPLISSLQQEAL
ncbi:ABC transporter permease [Shewanella gaetbuli]|uniref:ABC transporter permease n=1 Tax=Shewanella gaetbuli TaxID=220752 RepID=A0A9X2CGB8_9GAMM|nr:ABC transporter permease [Shewanella gaetbuli]MCL1142233.1 ABC transporter permease [Shewanella gaetbuli]